MNHENGLESRKPPPMAPRWAPSAFASISTQMLVPTTMSKMIVNTGLPD